jgi:thiol-disulfide isomerase/thioredoxin
MIDLDRQLRDVAEYLNVLVADVEVDEAIDRAGQVPVVPPEPRRYKPQFRRWSAAIAGLVVVLVAVGLVILATRGEDSGPAVTPSSTLPSELPSIFGLPAEAPPAFRARIRVTLEDPLEELDPNSPEYDEDRQFFTEELEGLPVLLGVDEFDGILELEYGGPSSGFRLLVPAAEPGAGAQAVSDGSHVALSLVGEGTHYQTFPESLEFAWKDWVSTCQRGLPERLADGVVAGRIAAHVRCATITTTWDLWVDPDTLVVLRVVGDGYFNVLEDFVPFPIASYQMESIDYQPVFAADAFAVELPDSFGEETDPLPNLVVGRIAPTLTGTYLAGGDFDLVDQRGRRTGVLWWATWCPPCLEALQDLQRVAVEGGHDVDYVTVIFRDDADLARSMMTEAGITLPAVEPANEWVDLIPFTFLIDADGRVKSKTAGFDAKDDIGRILDEAGW